RSRNLWSYPGPRFVTGHRLDARLRQRSAGQGCEARGDRHANPPRPHHALHLPSVFVCLTPPALSPQFPLGSRGGRPLWQLERGRGAPYPGTMDPSPAPLLRHERRGAFLLLFVCLLAVGAGNTMLTSAVLPPLTRELGLPDWTAGAIFSLSAAVWVVTAPYWGAKSNQWGRRRVVSIGMLGFAASMLFFAQVSGLAQHA